MGIRWSRVDVWKEEIKSQDIRNSYDRQLINSYSTWNFATMKKGTEEIDVSSFESMNIGTKIKAI